MNVERTLKKIEAEIQQFFIVEDFSTCNTLCRKLLRIASVYDNKYFMAAALGTTGYVLIEQGEYHKAARYIHKAMNISQEGVRGFADPGHLSICCSRLGDYEKALYWVDKAICAAEQQNHPGGMYDWYNYRANILVKQERYDDALLYTQKSIDTISMLAGDGNRNELYQPFLTRFEILSILGQYTAEYYQLKKRLEDFFAGVDEPLLHVKRDQIKFINLSDYIPLWKNPD